MTGSTVSEATYDGGFTLRRNGVIDGSVHVASRYGDIDLTLTAMSGRAAATLTAGLTPDEARELAGTLRAAAAAADLAKRKAEVVA